MSTPDNTPGIVVSVHHQDADVVVTEYDTFTSLTIGNGITRVDLFFASHAEMQAWLAAASASPVQRPHDSEDAA